MAGEHWVHAHPTLLPPGAESIFQSVSTILDPVKEILNVISGILDAVKTFIVGIDNPILLLIEAIINEIQQFISDLEKTGVYILVDAPLAPETGVFFPGNNISGQAYNDLLGKAANFIGDEKIDAPTAQDGVFKTEVINVANNSLEVVQRIPADISRSQLSRRRISYFGENLIGGMDGYRNRFRASLVDFKDSNRPMFSDEATVGGVSFVVTSGTIMNIVAALRNIASWLFMQLEDKTNPPPPDSFRAFPINKTTWTASLHYLEAGPNDAYDAVGLKWLIDAAKTGIASGQLKFMVGRSEVNGGEFIHHVDYTGNVSDPKTHEIIETDLNGVPIRVYKVIAKDLTDTTYIDSTVTAGKTYFYRVWYYATGATTPNVGDYMGTDYNSYTKNAGYSPTTYGQMEFTLSDVCQVSSPTPERICGIYDRKLGDHKVSFGTYPDWDQISLKDMIPFVHYLDVVNSFLTGLKAGYASAVDAIVDFINLIQTKIDTLQQFIDLIQSFLDALASLQLSPVGMLYIPFEPGGVSRVASIIGDATLPGSPVASANDYVGSVTVLIGFPSRPLPGITSLFDSMFKQ